MAGLVGVGAGHRDPHVGVGAQQRGQAGVDDGVAMRDHHLDLLALVEDGAGAAGDGLSPGPGIQPHVILLEIKLKLVAMGCGNRQHQPAAAEQAGIHRVGAWPHQRQRDHRHGGDQQRRRVSPSGVDQTQYLE